MATFLLKKLDSKAEVDSAITQTKELVLVLRFGREGDVNCLLLDDILAKTEDELRNMAAIYTVNVDKVDIYRSYFDITLIPATVFFFNGHHMRVDWGSPDNTKFIGSFQSRQDFIDVIEVIYRGAMKGKLMVMSPLEPSRVPRYDLIYKDI